MESRFHVELGERQEQLRQELRKELLRELSSTTTAHAVEGGKARDPFERPP